MMPGEGAAIAQFVQKNMRIPRRGEVGWTCREITKLEGLGSVWVMVRIRLRLGLGLGAGLRQGSGLGLG